MAEKKNPIQAVERAFKILELLSASQSAMSAIEISQELDLKRTTVYGLLESLMQLQYVVKNDNKYTVSGKLYSISYMYPNRFRVAQLAVGYMGELSQKYDCTVHLGILGMQNKVLLIKAAFPRNIEHIHSGSTFPLHASGVGKVLLAYQQEDKRKEILRSVELVRYTASTITDRDVLEKELETIRIQGYGEDRGELFENTFCVAVPIFDDKNTIVAAMSLSSDKDSISNSYEKLIPDVLHCSKCCSMDLGWKLVN